MADTSDILMVTSDERAGKLLTSAPVILDGKSNPFDALKMLAEKPYRAVLVDAEIPDIADLMAAIRRLRPKTKIYALCTARGEFELRRSVQRNSVLLEDYFIIPPTAGEWRRIADIPERKTPAPAATPAPPATPATPATDHSQQKGQYRPTRTAPVSLDGRQVTLLIESATDLPRLCDCIAKMTAKATGRNVAWRQGTKQTPPGVQQLMRIDSEPVMTLWADEPIEADNDCSRWISAMRMQIPSLLDNVSRMSALKKLATTDDLTGAYNRRYFMYFAEKMLTECRKRKCRATVLIYDIDDFKLYNDSYGHAAGDEILRETARLMKQITRKHDVVARIGGDEFAVLFCELGPTRQPGSQPIQTAYDLADRFRQAVNSHVFPSLGDRAKGKLTISGGLSNFPWDGAKIKELLAKADEGLLQAKRAGKNTITLVGSHE